MKTHQKNARLQVQYNGPGFLGFCHSLSEEERAFTRRGGRRLDAGKHSLREHQAQAAADREAAEEEQRNVERRTRRKEEREAKADKMVEGLEPILDLDVFRLLPATEPTNEFLRRQLVWLQVVGCDKGLPAGLFSNMNKERMKELVVEALERRVVTADIDEVAPGDLDYDQMDTDVALVPDDSEAELELIDEVGLGLSNTEGTGLSPSGLTLHLPPTPGSSSPLGSTPPIYQFGCRWDPINYSCAYDCAFMTFAWIYFHANQAWRTMWAGESTATRVLSRHFKAVFRAIDGPTNNRSTAATLFSSGRDMFRDVLSEENPTMFKRWGRVKSSFADILTSLSKTNQSSQFFSSTASCGGPHCRLKVITPRGAPFMLSPNTWNSIKWSTNPPHYESLQEWILGFFNLKVSSLPHHCSRCNREYSRTLLFLQPQWIWFEIFVEHPHVVLPPFKISLASHVYWLAAVIYGNACHFVARLSTPSGMWWYYDGMVNGGRPAVDTVTSEEDLIRCGDGYVMNTVVYCPA